MTPIGELATRCEEQARIAAVLFELEGRWSADPPEPRSEISDALVVHLATHSRYHGSQVELWRSVLPDSPNLEWPAPAVDGWDMALAVATELTTDGARAGALALALLPAAGARLARMESAAEAPDVGRVARLVRADLRSDLEGCTSLWHRRAAGDGPPRAVLEALTAALREPS